LFAPLSSAIHIPEWRFKWSGVKALHPPTTSGADIFFPGEQNHFGRGAAEVFRPEVAGVITSEAASEIKGTGERLGVFRLESRFPRNRLRSR